MAAMLQTALQAQERYQVGQFWYQITSANTAKAVLGPTCHFYSGDVTMPDSVMIGSSYYRVTAIGKELFLQSTTLRTVSLPSGLESIESGAFAYCEGLTAIDLPTSLRHISSEAFLDCQQVTHVRIPANVEYVGMGAFAAMSSLTDFSVDSANSHFSACDGILYDINRTRLVHYPSGRTDDTLRMAATTQTIASGAFRDCCFQYIEWPPALTAIESRAFIECERLGAVTLPATLQRLGGGAFVSCSGIQSVSSSSPLFHTENMMIYTVNVDTLLSVPHPVDTLRLPLSVTAIADFAVANAVDLRHVVCPTNLVSIGKGAFSSDFTTPRSYVSGLRNIEFNTSLKTIGEGAFMYSYYLESAHLPSGVTLVDTGAFKNCVSLASLTLPDSLREIPPLAFFSNPITTLSIPPLVERIGVEAFAYSELKQTLTFPPSVRVIEAGAFYEASPTLRKLVFQGHIDTLGENAFTHHNIRRVYFHDNMEPPVTYASTLGSLDNWAKLDTIYVPCDATAAYQDDTLWNQAKGIAEMCNGIMETGNAFNAHIYPNPARDRLTVERPDAGPATLEVFNAKGQKVMTMTSEQQTVTLDVSALAAGSYLLRVTTAEGSSVRTFVVGR